METNYYIIKSSIYALAFVPLPLMSIGFGLYFSNRGYKVKLNITIGLVTLLLLTPFIFIHYGGKQNYSTNIEYLDNVSNIINFKFSDDATIITNNIGNSNDPLYNFHYESVVRFKDEEKIREMENNMESNENWTNKLINNLSVYLPIPYYVKTADYDYYMLYNIEDDVYNQADINQTKSYYYLAYNKTTKILLIMEYEMLR